MSWRFCGGCDPDKTWHRWNKCRSHHTRRSTAVLRRQRVLTALRVGSLRGPQRLKRFVFTVALWMLLHERRRTTLHQRVAVANRRFGIEGRLDAR
jgi:hypothetical protein